MNKENKFNEFLYSLSLEQYELFIEYRKNAIDKRRDLFNKKLKREEITYEDLDELADVIYGNKTFEYKED